MKHINYTYHEVEGGIADALRLPEHFADGQLICVVLDDNVIETGILAAKEEFERAGCVGGHVILKQVEDPQRFGWRSSTAIGSFRIEEKPKEPKSRYAVIGIYMYDRKVFEHKQAASVSTGRVRHQR